MGPAGPVSPVIPRGPVGPWGPEGPTGPGAPDAPAGPWGPTPPAATAFAKRDSSESRRPLIAWIWVENVRTWLVSTFACFGSTFSCFRSAAEATAGFALVGFFTAADAPVIPAARAKAKIAAMAIERKVRKRCERKGVLPAASANRPCPKRSCRGEAAAVWWSGRSFHRHSRGKA